MAGSVRAIYLAAEHGAPQHSVDSARLVSGEGLNGDRHAGAAGVVSLIESEAVARFNAATGLDISPGATGRNIVTEGVALNDLVGREFRVGDVVLEAFELCEPCATLGARLATASVSAAEVVRTFTHSAGIRAYVRGTGNIRPGTPVTA